MGSLCRARQHNGDRAQGKKRLTVHLRIARSTGSTRLHSTRPAKLLCTPRVSAGTTGSSRVMVVRPSPCSTRRPRRQRRLCSVSSVWSASTSHVLPSSVPSTSSLLTRRSKRFTCRTAIGIQYCATELHSLGGVHDEVGTRDVGAEG